MSIHHLQCAAEVKIDGHFTASHKLSLMCFGNSAADETRIAIPGRDVVQMWSCAGRSWSAEILANLVELRLLFKKSNAYRGHRAEYIVFPMGCCERPGHGPIPGLYSALPDPFGGSNVADLSVVTGPFPLSTGALVRACPPDPFLSTGSGEIGRKGPVEAANGSGGPTGNRPSLKAPSKEPTNSGDLTGPLTSRDLSASHINPIDFAGGCRNPSCHAGDILDRNGEPIGKCPICQPVVAFVEQAVTA